MKSRVARFLSFGIALAAVTAVHAQDVILTADVPFSFYMGATQMPQGAYRVNQASHGPAVWLKSIHGDAMKIAITDKAAGNEAAAARPRLVFHRYGDDYFLAEIWGADASAGRTLARSPREKELAQSGSARIAVVQIALHR